MIDHVAGTAGLRLLQASWQASVLIALVFLARFAFRRWLTPRWRHALWILVLLRLALPVTPESPTSVFNVARLDAPIGRSGGGWTEAAAVSASAAPPAGRTRQPRSAAASLPTLLFVAWAVIAALLLARVGLRTYRLTSRVSRQRPVTRPDVVDMLEDCKQELGVYIPINVVQSSRVSSPALLGFLRPRLLLPDRLLDSFEPEALRLLFLHELAHAKRRDILVNWTATLVHVMHWFNPLVAVALARMRADRELATDSFVLSRRPETERRRYGDTLIRLLEFASTPGLLPGTVGVLEEKAELKGRVAMIARHRRDDPRATPFAAGLIFVLACATLTGARTTRIATGAVEAFDTAPAERALEDWLALVDAGEYGRSWDEASSQFRSAVTRAAWEKTVASARGGAGRLVSRKVRSATHESSLPGAPDGDYVVVQTDASFVALSAAVETVTMRLDADGAWRAVGYFVRWRVDTSEAENALQEWLALVDAQEYGKSWDAVAPKAQAAVSRAAWEEFLRGVRGPFGKLVSRRTLSAVPQNSLPGAPKGNYVVVQTAASFEHKKSTTETSTVELGPDGRWRVIGYFVR